jgi:hypothetical protein
MPIDIDTLKTVLWGVLVLLLLGSWLPALIAALGGTTVRVSGENALEELTPRNTQDEYAAWYQQAMVADYQPLGTVRVRVTYAGPRWRVDTPIRLFAHRANKRYFQVQYVGHPINLWFVAAVTSGLRDGSLLTTSSLPAAPPDWEAGFLRQGVASADLAELETLHEAGLNLLQAQGRTADSEITIDRYLELVREQYGEHIRKESVRQGWDYLLMHVIIHGCASLPAAYALNSFHWGVAVTNLMIWFLLYISDVVQKRQIAAMMRIARRETAAATQTNS